MAGAEGDELGDDRLDAFGVDLGDDVFQVSLYGLWSEGTSWTGWPYRIYGALGCVCSSNQLISQNGCHGCASDGGEEREGS